MRIPVLDKGYVRVTHQGGDDLTIVNAARVSYDRESEQFDSKDAGLLNYLAQNGHTSPFRHASLGLEIYAPLMVARQWWKHVVGAPFVDTPWNESSRRYVTEDPEFYEPEFWSTQAKDKKQGSAGAMDEEAEAYWSGALAIIQNEGKTLYDDAIEEGMAVEQARLFLPAYGLYVRWRWVPTVQALHHFVALREHEGAQWEIRQYASAVKTLGTYCFPEAMAALNYAATLV